MHPMLSKIVTIGVSTSTTTVSDLPTENQVAKFLTQLDRQTDHTALITLGYSESVLHFG